MHTVEGMLNTYPTSLTPGDTAAVARTIEALARCAQACTACAAACLAEDDVAHLSACVTVDLDCAEVCTTTMNVMSRRPGWDDALKRALLDACIAACSACADECARHATMHEHCKACADACRDCEASCRALLSQLTGA